MNLPWVPYYKLVFTDDLPDGVAGTARGWTVRIRPTWSENEGILAHEIAHVQLNYLNALTMGLLRAIMGRAFKLWTEARAYAIQTKYPNRDGGYLSVESAAERLRSPSYGFGLTHEQAVAEIENYL